MPTPSSSSSQRRGAGKGTAGGDEVDMSEVWINGDETHWSMSADPVKMLGCLRDNRGRGRPSQTCFSDAINRRLRLLACACCRRIWHMYYDERSQRAVQVAELFADTLATLNDVQAALAASEAVYNRTCSVARSATTALEPDAYDAALSSITYAACAFAFSAAARWSGARDSEHRIQADLLRDIFGNPFRPVVIEPAWLAWNDGTIPKLAQVIYEERELPSGHFDRGQLAILADALEEAGCGDAGLLGHLRGEGPHVRGCHVFDALLQRPS